MIYLKNYIDVEKVCSKLAQQLPSIAAHQIEQAFTEFFGNDERSAYWYYTNAQCKETVEENAELAAIQNN